MSTNDPIQQRGPSQVDEFGNVKPAPHSAPKLDADHPGYEVTDVNTSGVVVFLAGLLGFVIVFFGLCYIMGKAINTSLQKKDDAEAALNPKPVDDSASKELEQRRNMPDNAYLQQQEAARIAQSFPAPRLDADDGNQSTAEIHAHEDLLLEHTSVDDQDGTLRIPIEQAMALIAQRGLGTPYTPEAKTLMAGEREHVVIAPLTNGFARTAYELDQTEEREQALKLQHEAAEAQKK